MQFNKNATTIDEQIAILKARGLLISDENKAKSYLSNISYYRLSAYMLPFQRYNDPNHSFMPNVTFENILNLYVFDRQLRLLIFDEIERIEIAFRCQVIYQYSLLNGSNWYEEQKHFYNSVQFKYFLEHFNIELKQSKEVFIQHYKAKYSNPVNPPAWMSLEILSFGQLSKMFKNLRTSTQKKEVGNHFYIHHQVLDSWMESLTYIRNLCAHHSRIWNRTITVKPTIPNYTKQIWLDKNLTYSPDKISAVLATLNYLIKTINPKSSFSSKLKKLISEFNEVNYRSMGLPEGWESDKFWN
jgi:abortive infection bacteriophage resistance protein